jgi:hypothetical protein
MPIFTFPDDAAWNEQTRCVEFSVELGEYHGQVSVPRGIFQSLLPIGPTPEACVEAFHLSRARFERAAERKIARRELSADGNIDLTLKDLKEE